MMETGKAKKRLARREFLGTGAILAAGALGTSGTTALAAPAAAQAGNAQKPWLPKRWDYEADVVIAGLGFAGQSAAIAAHDAGAKVIVLEKAAKELSGGNSCCAVGGNSVWDDPKECYMDLRHAGQDVPDELVQTMVDALSMGGKRNVLNWLKKLGIETIAGGKSTKKTWFIASDGSGGSNGNHLYRAIQAQVEKRRGAQGLCFPEILVQTHRHAGRGIRQDRDEIRALAGRTYHRAAGKLRKLQVRRGRHRGVHRKPTL
jgi:hypothetical protein